MVTRTFSLKQWLVVGCGAVALACGATEASAQARTHHYAIQQQELGAALRAFALSSGRDVVFDPALVRGKSAPPVQGEMTDEDALRRLLQGSGLAFQNTGSGGFVVKAQAIAQAPAEPISLDDVTVTARKREERLIDVPFSLQVLGAEKLEKLGAVNFSKLYRSVIRCWNGLMPVSTRLIQPSTSADSVHVDQPKPAKAAALPSVLAR